MRWRFLIFLFLLIPSLSNAYSLSAHTTLTKEILNFYNEYYPASKISNDLVNFLIDGVRKEDDPPRYLNHFYDPINNKGLTIGWRSWEKAKSWAQNSKSQLAFKYLPLEASVLSSVEKKKIENNLSNKDFTWERAIRYWQDGEKEMAMYALGHVLHLLEDMAVPDHTRNDPHPEGSPYEIFTKEKKINVEILSTKQPINLKSVDEYFDSVAKYSNEGFYSKDTTNVGGYINPKSNYFKRHKDGRLYEFKTDKEFGDYFLARSNNLFSWVQASGKSIDNHFVLNDYWNRLSIKSIQHGAGLVNLFFEEANKKELADSSKPLLASLVDTVISKARGNSESGLKERAVISLEGNNQVVSSVIETKEPQLPACSYNSSSTPTHQNILINEIAWMGSVNDSNDEWVELKNISNDTFNISDWWLIDKDEQIKFNFPKESMVSRNGFYLLERTDDQSVLSVAADFVFKGSISNENEGLRLFDNNCILIDEVFAQPNWPAGINTERKTMERESNLNWHTGPVSGTPRMENSQPVIVVNNESGSLTGGSGSVNNSVVVNTATVTNATTPPLVLKVFISEFLFDAEGSDDNKEFIELYNPNDQAIDISEWSIQVASSSGVISKKNFEAGNKINSKGFFLIWFGDPPAGKAADMKWASGSLNNTAGSVYLVRNQDKIDGSSDSDIVDSFNYSKDTFSDFAPGKSLKRKDNIGDFQVSGSSTVENVTAPTAGGGFLRAVSFYKNNDDSNNYIDLIFDQYPFAPERKDAWKILAFYLNTDPLVQESITTDDNTGWVPQSNNLLSLQYPMYSGDGAPRYSVILPDTPEGFGSGGGISNVAYNYNFIEPNKIKIKTLHNATSTDYITIAYYDFESSGGGSQNFKLKLADPTRYYFKE